jgi:hypothetical protein
VKATIAISSVLCLAAPTQAQLQTGGSAPLGEDRRPVVEEDDDAQAEERETPSLNQRGHSASVQARGASLEKSDAASLDSNGGKAYKRGAARRDDDHSRGSRPHVDAPTSIHFGGGQLPLPTFVPGLIEPVDGIHTPHDRNDGNDSRDSDDSVIAKRMAGVFADGDRFSKPQRGSLQGNGASSQRQDSASDASADQPAPVYSLSGPGLIEPVDGIHTRHDRRSNPPQDDSRDSDVSTIVKRMAGTFAEGARFSKPQRGSLQGNGGSSKRQENANDDDSAGSQRSNEDDLSAAVADGDPRFAKPDRGSLDSGSSAVGFRPTPAPPVYGTPELMQDRSDTSVVSQGRWAGEVSVVEDAPRYDKADADSFDTPDANGQGLQFDDGPAMTGATMYGTGFAGALGVPALSYMGQVSAGSTITLYIENSSGQSTTGLLRVGTSAMEMKLRTGATVLSSDDVALIPLRLEPGTNQIQFTIPSNLEGDLYMQAAQVDLSALGGWSFSQGLQLFM